MHKHNGDSISKDY